MKNLFKRISSAIGTGARAFVALVGVAGITAAVANYAMTQGAGTNFGSVIVGGVHYAQQFICDLTTPAQCATVSAAGAVKTDGSAVTQPVSGTVGVTGVSTAANQTSQITQETAINTVLGLQADAACGTDTGTCSAIALIKRGNQNATSINNNVQAAIPAGTASIGNVGPLDYPIGAVPYTSSATATTTGAVATLAGAASVTTYICGFSVRANATAATTVNIVVSGTISGSLNFTQWVAPAASGLGLAEMIFPRCIPASAANTSIVVTGGAPGAGGVNSTTAWGYKL